MNPDPYWHTPQGDYASRRNAFLEFSAKSEGSGGRGGLFSQISRLEMDKPTDEESIRSGIQYVNERHDCADFTASGLLRILYKFRGHSCLSDKLADEIKSAILGFKYWIDEPGKELMCFWSENHQIMFHSDQYLAGQLYADEPFTNVDRPGAWHVEKARPRILRWIDLKVKTGFAEWDSNVYYDEDMTPLLNLVDFAEDEEIRTKAAMILDVMFFDMAVDSYRGTFGSSHGRTYPASILSGRNEASSGVQKIAWGMGCFNNPNNMTAVTLATSDRYRVPEIIESIAQHLPDTLVNRERQGFSIEDGPRLGIPFDDAETAMMAWGSGMGTRLDPNTALATADAFNSHRFSVVIRPYAQSVWGTYDALDAAGVEHDRDLDRGTLAPVNKYTYRTPDYQLSSAQDYRKGKPGFQQHIWQATLGPDAIVFALHRGNDNDEVYKYWVGRFPRVAQHENVLIALFDIPDNTLPGPSTVFPEAASGNAMPSPGPSEEELLDYTVAVFRRSEFDDVIEKNGWVLAQKDEGYIGLWSRQASTWTADGVLKGEGLVAKGRQNVWICQMGRKDVDGSFSDWCEAIAAAPIAGEGLSVTYDAPGCGVITFDWASPLEVDGSVIDLDNYPRFDNPYSSTPYGNRVYQIAHENRRLTLNFASSKRTMEQVT